MKHRFSLIITTICIALFTAFAAAIAVCPAVSYALESEGDLYYNAKVQDLMVYVYFEKPGVKVRLKDPEENIIDSGSKNAEFVEMDNMIMILVKDAAQGQWKLLYDKGSNSSIKADCQPYDKPIWITSLTTSVSGNELNVTFEAGQEGGDGRGFNYEIRLGTDELMEKYRTIGTGYGYVGQKNEKTCSLKDVNSYTDYYVQLFIYYDNGDTQNFDIATDGPISYTNPDAAAELSDVLVEINQSYGLLTVDFTDYASYDAKRAHVEVEADGTKIADQLFELTEIKDISTTFDRGVKEFKVKASVEYSSGRMSNEVEKTFPFAPDAAAGAFVLHLPTDSAVSGTKYPYSWENAKDQTVSFKADQENPVEVVLNGSGSGEIEIPESLSAMEVSYTDADHIRRVLDSRVSVDTEPPVLKLYEQLNGMVTEKESVLVAGKTEPGASLTCNDEPVEISENGTFTYEFKLEPGENKADFRASDAAGNTSLYSLTIKRGEEEQEEVDETNISSNKTLNSMFNQSFYIPVMQMRHSGTA